MSRVRPVLFLQSSSEGYGSGKIILQVLRFYQQEGFSPVVVLTNEGPIQLELAKLGIPTYVQNLGILRRKYVSPGGLINRLQKNIKAFKFLSRLHDKYNFELVYSNTLAVVVGAYWAKRKRLPHIWHIHEILQGPGPLVRWLSSILDSSTMRPIAVSKAVADHWQPFLQKARIQVIHNGIPYSPFLEAKPNLREELGLSKNDVLMGMVGRINPGKGQLFFLQMAKEIAKNHRNAHFVLVGDPFPGYEPILEEIKEEIQNLNLVDRVKYLGFREDIPEVMASLDVFVLPSIMPDSFPTVILEAMASGKPIVATLSGGASEMVVDGASGFLIPIGDVEKGVEALQKLLMDDSLREKFGLAGRERVFSEFSLEAFEKKILSNLWEHLPKD